ncbi:hypothetical protein QR680_010127 [Steinernema hermaphroditum]|uniref:Invertebrate defensins family profile domain-containing protein n=1 Tax=Steinernema hermaphroditum TaxID=289476 RepID=A0AA39IMV3_9BILA|nr:hypothetical protein QR680_010127 [Steinernema hermaphroditum]
MQNSVATIELTMSAVAKFIFVVFLIATLLHVGFVAAGHGCWKGSDDECNDFCQKTYGKPGKCEGFLDQVCTCQ